MKVTIEDIKGDGELFTVVWHEGEMLDTEDLFSHRASNRVIQLYEGSDDWSIATALPPLPRYPKPDDALLLHRYMAEGLNIRGLHQDFFEDAEEQLLMPSMLGDEVTITHCTDKDGNIINVAIKESDDD